MKVFISYAFNEANNWVEDLVIPLAAALGFHVVTGQRIAGKPLEKAIDDLLRGCAGCISFTTRRNPREDGSYESHPWVVNELHIARALQLRTVEVREEGVVIGDGSEAYAQLRYKEDKRDRLLIELAKVLASWIVRSVRVQLIPPDDSARDFRRQVLGGEVKCTYYLQFDGNVIGSGESKILAYKAGYFVDVQVPNEEDVLIQLQVKKADNIGAWKSLGDGLVAIPVELHDA
jgi:hypothetical protein